MPIIRGGTSRGAHVRALWWALTYIMDATEGPKRARIKTQRDLLERAYPGELSGDVDVAQWLAEEDGDALQE